MISRRGMVTGGAALAGATVLAAGPTSARDASPDQALAAVLDRLARGGGAAAERLAALEAVSPAGLGPAARLDRDAVLRALRLEARLADRFPFGGGPGAPYVVTPRNGAYLRAGEAAAAPAAAAALTARLEAETARLDHDAGLGVRPPVFVIDRLVEGLAAAGRAAAAAPDLAAALDRQRQVLLAQRPRAGRGDGVGRLPDGEAYYALTLDWNLGAPIAPAEAHRQGLEAARALTARADGLLRAQGLSQGGVGARLRALARDPRHRFADDDAGRDAAVAEMNRWLDAALARLPRSFAAIPPGTLAVRNRRMSPADEAAGRQGYRQAPSFDGSRPGAYFVDLQAIGRRPRWSLASVVHHETVAGHMLQGPLEAASGAHPLRTRLAAPGFLEGWAIYAEQLADEEGAFADDPLSQLGYLQWMLFRAGRLVVDTGLHARGWSRSRALAYLRGVQGDPAIFAPFAQDIERMATAPGAAAGQGLSWLALVRLRQARRAALGPRFDPRAFHDAVLAPGTLPLETLAARLG